MDYEPTTTEASMGLDMYLTKQTKENKREEAGYWRKANAIHNYFVENIQKGNDDQKAYRVSKKTFNDLLLKCNKIFEQAVKEGFRPDPDKDGMYQEGFKPSAELAELCAAELPTQSGFFFGSTEYDDWYFHQIAYTKRLIDQILENWATDDHKAYYYSCWW